MKGGEKMTSVKDFERVEEYKSWLRHYRLFRDYPIDRIREAGLRYLPSIASVVQGEIMFDLMSQWKWVLEHGSNADLRKFALEVSSAGTDRRQNTPLLGVMTDEDRLQALREARREFNAVH